MRPSPASRPHPPFGRHLVEIMDLLPSPAHDAARLMLHAGLSADEVCRVRVGDLEFGLSRLAVRDAHLRPHRATLLPSLEAPRLRRLADTAARRAQAAGAPAHDAPLFQGLELDDAALSAGRAVAVWVALTAPVLRLAWRRASVLAGAPDVPSIEGLRVGFALRLRRAGATTVDIARLIGEAA